MNKRLLSVKLQQEATSFSEIYDEIRFIKAQELLQNNDFKLIEIGHRLGFERQANFTRAFRRWSGKSPTELRKLQN